MQQIPRRPVPARGVASQRECGKRGDNQHCQSGKAEPHHRLTLSMYFIAGIHCRGANAAQARQEPQQQRRADQGRHRARGNFHPDARQPENELIGKPEDQRTNQRRQHQARQQTACAEHFCQQRRKQADKADDADGVNQ